MLMKIDGYCVWIKESDDNWRRVMLNTVVENFGDCRFLRFFSGFANSPSWFCRLEENKEYGDGHSSEVVEEWYEDEVESEKNEGVLDIFWWFFYRIHNGSEGEFFSNFFWIFLRSFLCPPWIMNLIMYIWRESWRELS